MASEPHNQTSPAHPPAGGAGLWAPKSSQVKQVKNGRLLHGRWEATHTYGSGKGVSPGKSMRGPTVHPISMLKVPLCSIFKCASFWRWEVSLDTSRRARNRAILPFLATYRHHHKPPLCGGRMSHSRAKLMTSNTVAVGVSASMLADRRHSSGRVASASATLLMRIRSGGEQQEQLS